MNKPFKTAKLLLALTLLSSAIATKAQPPTLQVPSNSDQVLASGYGTCVSLLNGTSIAYGASSGFFWGVCGMLGVTGATVKVTDLAIGTTISVTPSTTVLGQIDMAIGNNNMGGSYNAATDYILALSYTDNSNNIIVDFYDIYDDRSTTLTASYLSTVTRAIATTDTPNSVRMNAIAEFNNTSITGLPFVNKFVVTWAQQSGTSKIYAAMGDMNAQSLGTTQLISPSKGVVGNQPDVAAIRRHVSGPIGSLDYTAWITYTSGTELYLTEYDFSSSSALSTITLDNGSTSSSIVQPRIAAPDNYAAGSSNAHYTVVAQAYNTTSGFMETRDYDNNLYALSTYYVGSQFIDVSSIGAYSAYSPPYIEVSPVVATQPSNFLVAQVTSVPTTPTAGMAVTMEPIDPATSQINITPNNYFWVNGTGPTPPLVTLCGDPLVVTTPLNATGRTAVYAWVKVSSSAEIDYKNPTGFSFKQTPANTVTVSENILEVYPNPAYGELTISTYIEPNTSNTYQVTDLAGRQVMNGSLTSGISKISISQLAPGSYVMKLYKDGLANGEKIFVKN